MTNIFASSVAPVSGNTVEPTWWAGIRRIPRDQGSSPSMPPTTSASTVLPLTGRRWMRRYWSSRRTGPSPYSERFVRPRSTKGSRIRYTSRAELRADSRRRCCRWWRARVLPGHRAHTGTLAYTDGTTWSSAFNASEWQTLWTTRPNTRSARRSPTRSRPRLGLRPPDPGDGDGRHDESDPGSTHVLGSVGLFLRERGEPDHHHQAWVYQAQAAGTGTNVLLTDPQSNALSLIRTYPDGRRCSPSRSMGTSSRSTAWRSRTAS